MPYKFETMHKKLPKELDRRIKLTDEMKDEIKELIQKGLSDSSIALMYNVNRKSIYYIRHPEKHKEQKEAYKLRRLDGRYYNKEKHTLSMKANRNHKKENINSLI